MSRSKLFQVIGILSLLLALSGCVAIQAAGVPATPEPTSETELRPGCVARIVGLDEDYQVCRQLTEIDFSGAQCAQIDGDVILQIQIVLKEIPDEPRPKVTWYTLDIYQDGDVLACSTPDEHFKLELWTKVLADEPTLPDGCAGWLDYGDDPYDRFPLCEDPVVMDFIPEDCPVIRAQGKIILLFRKKGTELWQNEILADGDAFGCKDEPHTLEMWAISTD